jgi:hypothetical protein
LFSLKFRIVFAISAKFLSRQGLDGNFFGFRLVADETVNKKLCVNLCASDKSEFTSFIYGEIRRESKDPSVLEP